MSTLIVQARAAILRPNFIWTIVIFLAFISMLAVLSTSESITRYKMDNMAVFLGRHVVFMLFGLGLVWLFSNINYTAFNRWAPYLLIAAIILLVMTFFVGVNVNDAKRWLPIPFTRMTFQVSDFAKLALILYLARSISEKQDTIKGFKSAFVPIMLPILLVCGLIAPSNLSTAGVLFMGSVIMMFVGRIDLRYIFMIVIFGVALFFLLLSQIHVHQPY